MSSKKPDKEELIIPETAEAIDFVKALVARGEAAKVNPDGSLPPGATHEIVGETKKGFPILRRRRYSGIV
jgi:hypothetical protein